MFTLMQDPAVASRLAHHHVQERFPGGVVSMAGWLIGIIVAGVVCVGCTTGPDDSSSAREVSTPRTTGSDESSSAGDVPPPPEVGQCRNTPESNLGGNDWVDESPVVDCSKPHTLETVNVIESGETMTLPLIKQLASSCESIGAWVYLDSPGRGAYKIAFPLVYGPSQEQREAGQSWVRCDAGIQAMTYCCIQLAPQTGSLKGAMGENLARFQQCINEVPDPDRTQPLTSCEKPHRAELLLTIMELDASEYPYAAQLEKSGQSLCRDLVGDRDDADSLVLTTLWQPKSEWRGGTLYGVCWIRRDAGVLPAL